MNISTKHSFSSFFSCNGKNLILKMLLLKKECFIVEKFYRNHLRPIRRFYSAHLFSKSTNSIFTILIDFWGMILRIGFKKLFNNDQEKCNKKFYSKLYISCLGTGWENKNELLWSKISTLIELLVSVMSVNFLYIEKTTFEEFDAIC